jgi:hypothetical protein
LPVPRHLEILNVSYTPSEDDSECDGWRRELGDDEVRENYMDSKFGGEDADMAESVTA